MNIPSKVKIGAKWFDVTFTECFDKGADQYGEIDYFTNTIRLRPIERQTVEQTLLHEIIHGMLFDMGITNQKEKFIEGFANELHRLIYDNPLLFAEPIEDADDETDGTEKPACADAEDEKCD